MSSTSYETRWRCMSHDRSHWEKHGTTSVWIMSHESAAVRTRLRDIPQSNWAALIKNFQAMEDKERISYSSGWNQELWQINVTRDPGMDLGSIKNRIGTNGESEWGLWIQCKCCVNATFLTLMTTLRLCGAARWLSRKDPPANAGDMGLILGGEDPLEKGMATHSSILAWKIPWTEGPGGLQAIGSQKSRTWLKRLINKQTKNNVYIYMRMSVCECVCSEVGGTAVNGRIWVKDTQELCVQFLELFWKLEVNSKQTISNVCLQETLGLTKLEAVAGSISTKTITENSGEWAGMESLIISQPENVTEQSEEKVVMERNQMGRNGVTNNFSAWKCHWMEWRKSGYGEKSLLQESAKKNDYISKSRRDTTNFLLGHKQKLRHRLKAWKDSSAQPGERWLRDSSTPASSLGTGSAVLLLLLGPGLGQVLPGLSPGREGATEMREWTPRQAQPRAGSTDQATQAPENLELGHQKGRADAAPEPCFLVPGADMSFHFTLAANPARGALFTRL